MSRQRRKELRQVRPRILGVLQRSRRSARHAGVADSRRVAAPRVRKVADARRTRKNQIARRSRKTDRSVPEGARGRRSAPGQGSEGRQRGQRRPGRRRPAAAGQKRRGWSGPGQEEKSQKGLGRAPVQKPRRFRRTRHAQHQNRAASAAQIGADRQRRRARHGQHDSRNGRQRRDARHQDAARAQKHRESAVLLRHRRIDGCAREAVRRTVFGDAHRVQTPRELLLPQLHLRIGVEGQSTAHERTDADVRHPQQIRARLQSRVRRRRDDGAVRNHACRRQRRALERRARCGMDQPIHAAVPEDDLDQSDAAGNLGVFELGRDDARTRQRQDVSADDPGSRRGHERPHQIGAFGRLSVRKSDARERRIRADFRNGARRSRARTRVPRRSRSRR